MNALLIGLLLCMACITVNLCYQVLESNDVAIMTRREEIRNLLNLQLPTKPDKFNDPHCGPPENCQSCRRNCDPGNCFHDCNDCSGCHDCDPGRPGS